MTGILVEFKTLQHPKFLRLAFSKEMGKRAGNNWKWGCSVEFIRSDPNIQDVSGGFILICSVILNFLFFNY